jgi:hypothetical protein
MSSLLSAARPATADLILSFRTSFRPFRHSSLDMTRSSVTSGDGGATLRRLLPLLLMLLPLRCAAVAAPLLPAVHRQPPPQQESQHHEDLHTLPVPQIPPTTARVLCRCYTMRAALAFDI